MLQKNIFLKASYLLYYSREEAENYKNLKNNDIQREKSLDKIIKKLYEEKKLFYFPFLEAIPKVSNEEYLTQKEEDNEEDNIVKILVIENPLSVFAGVKIELLKNKSADNV